MPRKLFSCSIVAQKLFEISEEPSVKALTRQSR